MKRLLFALAPAAYPLRILVHARRRRDAGENPGAVAVLGTAQYDGRSSRQLLGRLEHARDLARRWPEAKVFTLGGSLPGDRFAEAGVSRTFLLEQGISADRITALEVGSDTRTSAEALAAQNPGRVVAVTDPHHALRTEKIFRSVGLDAVVSPTPYCPVRFPVRQWWLTLAHEVGGLLVADVFLLAGARAADRVEDSLRRCEGALRPSRRARHEHIRAGK
ncbi:YdcF family protein [Corynebacterium doosanense]|uniref:DUF218 domain-containing protein n=1 Tax=Corynebacterium doosanense CAU 212 = DSM 45436 TaxID=558173 RepID=A0A097IHG3_9CORY|nr:YdcF family protein [Corynebacterium doosanense]AIT61571.1 hypothetical protein CDOO_10070 [Corynebacterium doosanense CAU 212 = DSM 45436]